MGNLGEYNSRYIIRSLYKMYSNIKQICICKLELEPYKTPTVRPPAPYHENYSS